MKFNSIITVALIGQCLSDTPTNECVKEKQCAKEDIKCLLECLAPNIAKPTIDWTDSLECSSKCPWDGFFKCAEDCNSRTYKNKSNDASMIFPLLSLAIPLSLSYWLI